VNPGVRTGLLIGVLMIALGAWVVVGASDGGVLFGGVCMLAGGIGWFGYMLVFTLKTAGEQSGLGLLRSGLRTDAAWTVTLGRIAVPIGAVGLIGGVSEALFTGAVRSGLYTAGLGVLVIVSSLLVARRQAARRRRSQQTHL
jgi:hypothetical protein